MEKEKTSTRLKQIMDKRNLRQVDILKLCEPLCLKYNVKMNKSDISQYVSGKVEPSQDKLFVLANALGVSEAWLMGYEVTMDRNFNDDIPDENYLILSRNAKKLTPEQREQLLKVAKVMFKGEFEE